MHYSSMVKMAQFAAKYDCKGKTVVDIGSLNVNGTYRILFPESTYIGVDIVKGQNVDVIMDSKEWDKLKDVDIVISGQTLEHVEDVPKLMKTIFDVLKPDGIICIIAPSAGPPHEPPWFGNISKKQMIKLVSDGGFKILSCTIHPVRPFDNCCIATKEKKGHHVAKDK